MKANEAPEKIYIIPHTLTDGFCRRWFEEPFKIEYIEYIRKDAFVEKACEFIETYPHLIMGVLRSEVIEDFKNYMKG